MRIVIEADDAIREMEKGNWTPCSEGPPKKDGRYLVEYPLPNGKDSWVSIKWYGKPNQPNRPVKGKCFYESDAEYGDIVWDNIIAWMPLPKSSAKSKAMISDESVETLKKKAISMAIAALSEPSKKKTDCNGCRHFDTLQTSLICHECARYYRDKYSE